MLENKPQTGRAKTALELLAPAKNLELGRAAIDHGADAVYTGAQQFGARAAAGNSIADIEQLCTHAHRFHARVYVALNTLIFDRELEAVQTLIHQVWNAGADALIIQDMGILEMDLPPIPLFASTQTDNRTPEKVKFLEENGFSRVILARELGLDAIRKIRAQTRVDLETFVHGALCVSFSGQCYMSAAIGGRSANRGACGQPCRLPWTLRDKNGQVLEQKRHLLSLKDMDRSEFLADLVDAGVTSFKIEGRLKDMAYVKNITGFYRRHLDALIEDRPETVKASLGTTRLFFTPDPAKTFNRGRTDYFLHNKRSVVDSFDTPKSMGEQIGRVKSAGPNWIMLDRPHNLHNADGICFLDKKRTLKGFQVNRVDNSGKIFVPGRQARTKGQVPRGSIIFRNHDQDFARILAGNSAERKIGVTFDFSEGPQGFVLDAKDDGGNQVRMELTAVKEPAKNPDRARAVIEQQLAKLGSSMFYARRINILCAPYFLVAKDLNRLRRDAVSALEAAGLDNYQRQQVANRVTNRPAPAPFFRPDLDFRGNVANALARRFYEKRGVETVEPAFELAPSGTKGPVMTTRHCIRYSLGLCPRQRNKGQARQETGTSASPLYLENEKGRFCLQFNCKACEMDIFIA